MGREAERAQLHGLMRAALAGEGALVLIGGEPGVGKSRLSQEISAEARQRCTVRVGHCYEREADLPYMPWVEMIESLARELPPEALREALGEEAPEFARLVPHLRRLLPDIPPPLELPPDQQRRYTFSCLREYVSRASRVEPRLYILEDLHWADESTLLLLEHLAERLPEIPCLVIGTYRDPPADVSPRLADLLSALIRRRLVRVITLKRHSEAEVEALLAALSGHRPPGAVSAAFYAETEGNAFFVEELFRHLEETGRLLDERGDFRADLRLEELDVPENVRLVTGQRLDRLSEGTRQLLTVGAVIGRRFSVQLVEALGELSEEATLDAADEAERARLIFTEQTGRRTLIWFAHELVRQTLLARLSALRRERYHLRIAEALERMHAADLPAHASDIAHHLVQAHDAAPVAKTAEYLTLSGDRAQTASAFEEALRYYGDAIALMQPLRSADAERHRGQVLLKLGWAQRSLGRWEESVQTWQDALSVLESTHDRDVPGLCADLCYQLAWAHRLPELLEVARRGLRHPGATSAERTRLQAAFALALALSGRIDEGSRAITEATDLISEQTDPRVIGEVSLCCIVYHNCLGQFAQGVPYGRRAVDTLRGLGADWSHCYALAQLEVALFLLGSLPAAGVVHEELDVLVRRIGDRGSASAGRRSEFMRRAAGGDLRGLETLCAEQWAESREMEAPVWLSFAHAITGTLRFWQGDLRSAQEHLEEAPRQCHPVHRGMPEGQLFHLMALSGRHGDASRMLGQLRAALPSRNGAALLGAWQLVSFLAEGVGVLGDEAAARDLYPLACAALDMGMVFRLYDGRMMRTGAAVAAAAAGLSDEAELHFDTAMQQADQLPHVIEQPHVRHHYARFLMERGGSGDVERAGALLEEAATGYRSIGMPRHLEWVEVLQSRLGGMTTKTSRSRALTRPRHPDSLTGREVEILELLASGLTSAELAARLCLSVGTIQRHIANIYSKIGVRNRAEATAYALTQQLADLGRT